MARSGQARALLAFLTGSTDFNKDSDLDSSVALVHFETRYYH
jgi:hypothetical protein